MATVKVWTPVGDDDEGVRPLDPNVGCWVYGNGERISLSTSRYEIFADLPDDIRLCRATEREAVSVPVVAMTAERIAALESVISYHESFCAFVPETQLLRAMLAEAKGVEADGT